MLSVPFPLYGFDHAKKDLASEMAEQLNGRKSGSLNNLKTRTTRFNHFYMQEKETAILFKLQPGWANCGPLLVSVKKVSL